MNNFHVRLAVLVCLLVSLSFLDSSTHDEPAHLASGIYDWQFPDRALYYVNPPLARMVAAFPASFFYDANEFLNYSTSDTLTFWGGGAADYIWSQDGRHAELWLAIGRCCLIPFAVLGLWSTEALARFYQGKQAGALAGWLYVSSPTLLSAGHSIAADGICAALLITFCHSFVVWMRSPSWLNCVLSGFLLGLALLSKTLVVLLVPGFCVAWFIESVGEQRISLVGYRRAFGQFAVWLYVAWIVLNSAYYWRGVFVPLSDYQFASCLLSGEKESRVEDVVQLDTTLPETGNRFKGTWLGCFPVPLPAMYVYGIDRQKADLERKIPTYLGGRWRDGRSFDILHTAFIKMPLGGLCVVLIGVVLSVRAVLARRQHSPSMHSIALITIGILLIVNMSQSNMTIYFRYLAPVLPLVYAHSASVIVSAKEVVSVKSIFWWSKAIVLLVAMNVVEVGVAYPHVVSFCNWSIGGPWGGQDYYYGTNENGQNLWRLIDWINTKGIEGDVFVCQSYAAKLNSITGWKVKIPPTSSSILARLERDRKGQSEEILASGWYVSTDSERNPFQDVYGNSYLIDCPPIGRVAPGLSIYYLSDERAEALGRGIIYSYSSSRQGR